MPRAVDLELLWDPTHSYHYTGNYELFPIRPGRGDENSFLQVMIDSASFRDDTRSLCIKGSVVNFKTYLPMAGVQVLLGNIQPFNGQIINNDRAAPTPTTFYRMSPIYRDSADSKGRISFCVEIDAESRLMFAKEGFFVKIYEVGKLLDTSSTNKR